LQIDLTEVYGLDNLKNPVGCLKKAQALAAGAFGACQTFFLVNGSTAGLHAALLAVNKPETKIIMPTNAHVSVLNGLVLSGGIPVLAPVEIAEKWGIALGTPVEKILSIILRKQDIQAILVTQPTYQGTGVDVENMIMKTRQAGIPLIVDEAHGAHLYFQESIPLSAQKSGADLVIQSTHKTLPALTQASMFHVNNEKWIEPVRRALDILQTSSPSYLLMASLDAVQAQMNEKGPSLLEKTMELAEELHSLIRTLPGYLLLHDDIEPPWRHDPTKVVISAAQLGLTGWEQAFILREKYGIAVEMSEYFYTLLLINTGHTRSDIIKIHKALRDIGKYEKKQPLDTLENYLHAYKRQPDPVLTPRQVFLKEKIQLPLHQAKGRVAGEPLTIYPPGIPLVWPGEVFIKEHLEILNRAIKQKLPVQGIYSGDRVYVLRD